MLVYKLGVLPYNTNEAMQKSLLFFSPFHACHLSFLVTVNPESIRSSHGGFCLHFSESLIFGPSACLSGKCLFQSLAFVNQD